ncbi:hypothetical protein [Leptolyngbya sp. 'hensonii']|uniref:hypothetical protein n=1 Tax=Leptolyngbya sp. 'hensonii' TaxID=1922337 RepID=UPI000AAA5CD3|nr:hypothetical protein [Leptolyngbya sp. 'hensonii']
MKIFTKLTTAALVSAGITGISPVVLAESPAIYLKQGTWNINQKACIDSAVKGLRQNRFQALTTSKSGASGEQGNYRAVVTCETIDGVRDRIWYLIVVSGPTLAGAKQLGLAIDKAME